MFSRRSIFRDILSSPEAHGFLLNALAVGESDSAGGLDRVAELIPEPATRRRVFRHYEEEVRHGVIFNGRLKRLGRTVAPVPPELDYVALVRKRGFGLPMERLRRNEPLTPEEEVRFFCAARIDEERGILEMSKLKASLQADPDTASVLEEILRDERGHVGYTAFELKRLEKDGYGELIRKTLIEFREIENRVHAEVAAGFMDRLGRILGTPTVVRLLVRASIHIQAWWQRLTLSDRYDARHLVADVKPLGHEIKDAG